MADFQLFRLTARDRPQRTMYSGELTREELIRQAILSEPHFKYRTSTWRVGNAEMLGDEGIYCAFGRNARTKIQWYDGEKYRDRNFEGAPFTHVFVDAHNGVCAIASKPLIARQTQDLATMLQNALNSSATSIKYAVAFDISPINDPSDFVAKVRGTTHISKFVLTLSPPNPFDAEEDFQKPSQRALASVGGTSGKIEVDGKDIPAERVAEIALSAASMGEDIKVTGRAPGKAKSSTFGAKSVPLTLRAEEPFAENLAPDEGLAVKLSVWRRMREAYLSNRKRAAAPTGAGAPKDTP